MSDYVRAIFYALFNFSPMGLIRTLLVLIAVVFASLVFGSYFKNKYTSYKHEKTVMTEKLHKTVFGLMSFTSFYAFLSPFINRRLFDGADLYYVIEEFTKNFLDSLMIFFVFILVLLFIKGRYRYNIKIGKLILPTTLNVFSLISTWIVFKIISYIEVFNWNGFMMVVVFAICIIAMIFYAFARSKYDDAIRYAIRERKRAMQKQTLV